MNVSSKLKTPIQITTETDPVAPYAPEDLDRYGNLIPTREETDDYGLILPSNIQRMTAENEDRRELTNAYHDLYLAPGSNIYSDSTVEWTDNFGIYHEAEVDGDPKRLQDKNARPVMIMVLLRESEYR